MAQAVGIVKAVEKGTFYVKDPKGYMHQVRTGDTVKEGDLIFGAPTNMADAKIIIDVTLPGAGDLVISQNGALTFDSSVLAGMFNSQDAVVHVNSMQEALSVATSDIEAPKDSVPVDATEKTAAGDETAAGEEVTNTEYVGDVFSSPDGMITDVTTDLRATSASLSQVTVNQSDEILIENTEGTEPTPPPPPPGEEEINVPLLDVKLGAATENKFIVDQIEKDIPFLDENGKINKDVQEIDFSAIGGGEKYLNEDGKLNIINGNVPSVNATVKGNHGNGYGVDSDGEQGDDTWDVDTTGTKPEALILDMNQDLISLNVDIKHSKADGEIQWEIYDGNGIFVGSGTYTYTDNDSESTVNISSNTAFQYVVFIGTGNDLNGTDGYNVKYPTSGVAIDYIYDYTYTYPLEIIDASLLEGSVGTLGDVVVTGLPVGAELSDGSTTLVVPADGTVVFGSDTEPVTWTLTVDEPLSEDTSIVASLTSISSDGNSATSYVGVYGENEIVAGDGDDILDGGADVDQMYGGDGNDTLIFDSNDEVVDGGTGTDTLVLLGSTSIDFESWNSDSLSNIEVIDLTSGDHDLSNLSLSDVVAMTDMNNNVYILGDAGDRVDFLNDNGWSISTDTPFVTQTVNGMDHTFDVYVNANDPTVTVHVEQVITDTI